VIELLRVEVGVSVASFEVRRSSRETVGPCANTVDEAKPTFQLLYFDRNANRGDHPQATSCAAVLTGV
jgi:hypothetical protein